MARKIIPSKFLILAKLLLAKNVPSWVYIFLIRDMTTKVVAHSRFFLIKLSCYSIHIIIFTVWNYYIKTNQCLHNSRGLGMVIVLVTVS